MELINCFKSLRIKYIVMHDTDKDKNNKLITCRVPNGMDNEMEKLIDEKEYDNRSEVIRKAVEGLLKRET